MKDPIKESTELIQETTSSIKSLGPVTVGFFILLCAILFAGYTFLETAQENVLATRAAAEGNAEKLGTMDEKLSKSITKMQESSDRLINAMVQTCINTSKTEIQRTACLQLPPSRL